MRPILAFVAIVAALGIAVSLAVMSTGGPRGPLGALAFATMTLPAVAAYIVRATTNQGPRIDWSRLPARYLPVALLLIPAVMHAAMLPAMRAAAGRLPWSGHPAWPAVAVNAIAGLFVVSGLALFEEIGWRGWLLPRLMDRYDVRAAVLSTSAIWAVWHVPFVLSGLLAAGGVSTPRMVIVELLGVGGAGLVLGWLWVRTQSIWIVALAHGAMNDWGQFAFKYMQAAPAFDLAPVLLAGSAAVVVTGVALLATLGGSMERVAACTALILAAVPPARPAAPLDYTQGRGTSRDGSASAFVVPAAWPAALDRQRRVDVGEGYSRPIVAGTTVDSSVALWTVR